MRALIVSLVLCASASAAHAQDAECTPLAMGDAWQAGIVALESGDFASGAAAMDPVIAACTGNPQAEPLHVLRAELAVRLTDFQRARDLMAPIPRPSERSFGIVGAWTALRAAFGLGDAAAIDEERRRLLLAVEDGLVRGGARLRERVETPGGSVAIYETDLLQEAFRRRYIALYDRTGDLPITATLTLNTMVELMFPEQPGDAYLVDGYYCAGHATLDQLHAETGELPPYESFRSRALRFFASPPPDEMAPGAECAFQAFITPDPFAPPEN